MKALITGGSGFVGHHLRAHLEAVGDTVVTTDRRDGGPDLLDADALEHLIAAEAPDAIYHLAGQSDVAASWKAPAETFQVNGLGTLHLLDAAQRCGVQRVLAVTSAEVYGHVGPDDLPIHEARPLAPASPYAASKAAAEMVCIHYASQGLGVLRARAFNHLGPGQTERFVAPALAGRVLRAIRDGDTAIPVGRLDTRRDFTDVRDVVRAYRRIVDAGVVGEAYNVCSGVDRAIQDVATAILEATGNKVDLEPDPALQRPSDVPVLQGDNSKLVDTTGWQPEIPFTTTIADVVEDRRAHLA